MTAIKKWPGKEDQFESPLPHMSAPCISGGFDFLKAFGDKMGTRKFLYYKPPKLSGSTGKRFIEVYYRVPKELKDQFPGEWKRFKIYDGINRYKSEEYAQYLLELVTYGLQNGWNPFKKRLKHWADLQNGIQQKVWTIQQGISYFLQSRNDRGLEKASVVKYERACAQFQSWLNLHGLQNLPAEEITFKHIEAFLIQTRKKNGWTNSTYNNTRSFLSTAFLFMVTKKIITANPCIGTDKLKVVTKKHRYYDPATLEKLKAELAISDPYLLFAFQTVYYLCIRSEKELKNLQVKHIMPERMQVFIKGGKTGDRYIPLSKEMLDIFKARGILNADKEYYVFSSPHTTKFVADGRPGPRPFGNGFFSKRFRKIREALGLGSDFTLYGAKHLRIIHLKTDGVSDANIMSLTGHSSFAAYTLYLRDIGMTADVQALEAGSRRF